MEPQRKAVFEKHGAKCSECGFDGWHEALTIVADKTVKELGYRLKFLNYCVENLHKCRVVCLNCRAKSMAEGREKPQVEMSKPHERWFVWAAFGEYVPFVRYGFLERMVKEGYRVAVWAGGKVQEYMGGELAANWPEFARRVGASESTPEENLTID